MCIRDSYRGDGRGGFEDVTAAQGLERVTLPMGANYGDLDNDGFADFYLGTGYPGFEGLVPNVMYHNLGGSGFEDVTMSGGFGHLQKGHGVAFADLDNDGDQDVYEQIGGFFRDDGFANALFENPGFGHGFVTIELRGRRSNRFGVGARIRLVVRDGDATRSIYHHVGSGGSFGGNPLRAEIGLGNGKLEKLEVYWPTTGAMQVHTDIEANSFVRIVEGRREVERIDARRVSFADAG